MPGAREATRLLMMGRTSAGEEGKEKVIVTHNISNEIGNRTMGRKPKGERAMTNAERQKALRDRRKEFHECRRLPRPAEYGLMAQFLRDLDDLFWKYLDILSPKEMEDALRSLDMLIPAWWKELALRAVNERVERPAPEKKKGKKK